MFVPTIVERHLKFPIQDINKKNTISHMEYVKLLDINPLFLKFRSIHPSMNMMWLLFSAKVSC